MTQSPKCAESPVREHQSAQYWTDLAVQRGLLLKDLTDTWAERRVAFVQAKRAMGEKLFYSRLRERTLTRRIAELEKTLMIVWSLIHGAGPSETRISAMFPYVKAALPHDDAVAMKIDEPPRGVQPV